MHHSSHTLTLSRDSKATATSAFTALGRYHKLLWVPSQYGGFFVCLHAQRYAVPSLSAVNAIGVNAVPWCDPSQLVLSTLYCRIIFIVKNKIPKLGSGAKLKSYAAITNQSKQTRVILNTKTLITHPGTRPIQPFLGYID